MPARKTSPETVGRQLLDTAQVEIGGSRPWDIQIHNSRLFERVLGDRELGLGEAYQDGWWDAERVDQFLERVMVADLRSSIRPSPSLLWLSTKAALVNRQGIRQAGKNASAHYDIGNDLYERMLDKRMLYSCAYWREQDGSAHDDLDAAQELSLIHISEPTRPTRASRMPSSA